MRVTYLMFVVSALALFESSSATFLYPPSLLTVPLLWKWEKRTPATLPDQCNFIYGGGFKRMLYVGRVRRGNAIVTAAIHHYGKAGSETARIIENGAVTGLDASEPVEWLCGKGNLGWANVKDLSTSTILKSKAVPVGYDFRRLTVEFACLVHSFFNDQYPASVGVVANGGCQFEINGQVVNSNDFNFWHTTELLVVV